MSSDVRKIIDPGAPYSRTLKQYSIDEKLAIISHAKNHGNRAAGREFNVAESSIREWRKNENKLIHNRNAAAAGLASLSASASASHHQSSHLHPSVAAAGSANLNNNNNNNNNNNHHNKNGHLSSLQQQQSQHVPQTTGGIFRISNENQNRCGGDGGVFPRRTHEDMMKLQLVQLAMMNMDFNNLAQLAPLLHLQHQRQLAAFSQNHQALPDSSSTSSSVVGTPSSISSSSTPPPSLSPVPSGSGRRKLKCPQKITTTSESESADNVKSE